jgi:GT2 family glycosyltransferase
MGVVCRLEYLSLSRVYIIIVNWNGWKDTIECLESVFRSDFYDYRVIVCDNGSSDGSLEHVMAWAENRLDSLPEAGRLRDKSYPPVSKPISYVIYNRAEAESGDCLDGDSSLILIRNESNLGFAGGNNVGMRYALICQDFDFVWLLNNDTVVNPDSLSKLVRRMLENKSSGMCGSTLLHYDNPDRVQALGGGYYCKWIGLPWHQGRLKKSGSKVDKTKVERWMNYIIGASMLVSKEFIQNIGLMSEDYFLYFEEVDWAIRGKERFSLAFAPESVVYHKVGSSIGTSSNPRKKSLICDYYNIRNRLFFTRRYFPYSMPAIYAVLFGTLLLRVFTWKWERARMIAGLFLNYNNRSFEKNFEISAST